MMVSPENTAIILVAMNENSPNNNFYEQKSRTSHGNPRYATKSVVKQNPTKQQAPRSPHSRPHSRVTNKSKQIAENKNHTLKVILIIFFFIAIIATSFILFISPTNSGNPPQDRRHDPNTDSPNSLASSNEPKYTPRQDLGDRANDLQLDPSRNTGWRLETDGTKKIYLTFDDGPSDNTENILNILAQSDVKATFFVTGHYPEKFGLIKKEYDAGHSVGMHTYTHDYSKIYPSVDAYKADLERISNVIKDQIGFVPFLFRFPGGSSNGVSAKYCEGIMTQLTTELVNEGYQYFDWNISSGDAGGDDIPAQTLIDNSCQDGWTNIVLLMHDTDAKKTTTEALPQIIKFYKERGYEFCAIKRDSFAVHHKVSN